MGRRPSASDVAAAPPAPTQDVDLREAAERLGVHYQTAYQWVRSGDLPAVRLRNRYRISVDDLERFAQERDTPRPVAVPPRGRRWEHTATRWNQAVLEGDERTARSLLLDLRDEGVPATELVERVVVPALRDVGEGWVRGQVSIAQEHRASRMIERLLGELTPTPRGRRRGTAVVAAVSGDHHTLPTSMAALALRDDRWRVEHLGADVPADELVRFAVDADADLVVLTVTNPDRAAATERTRRRLDAAGIACIVGAPGRTLEELQAEARAT